MITKITIVCICMHFNFIFSAIAEVDPVMLVLNTKTDAELQRIARKKEEQIKKAIEFDQKNWKFKVDLLIDTSQEMHDIYGKFQKSITYLVAKERLLKDEVINLKIDIQRFIRFYDICIKNIEQKTFFEFLQNNNILKNQKDMIIQQIDNISHLLSDDPRYFYVYRAQDKNEYFRRLVWLHFDVKEYFDTVQKIKTFSDLFSELQQIVDAFCNPVRQQERVRRKALIIKIITIASIVWIRTQALRFIKTQEKH